ncbi:protein of unknown function (plasmid) [Caballeronia sp. S22]
MAYRPLSVAREPGKTFIDTAQFISITHYAPARQKTYAVCNF